MSCMPISLCFIHIATAMSSLGQEGKSAVYDLLAVSLARLVRLPRLLALLQNEVVDVEIMVVSSFYDLV